MRWRAIVVVALALSAAACIKSPPAGPPVVVEPSQVEALIYQSADLSGRLVSMDGYVNFDNGADGHAIAMRPELRTGPLGGGQNLIGFEVEYGAGPNQLALHEIKTERPSGFPASVPEITTFDIARVTYQDASGAAHPIRQKIRITGRLAYAQLGGAGPMSDPDPRAPGGRRFKPRLVEVVLEVPPR